MSSIHQHKARSAYEQDRLTVLQAIRAFHAVGGVTIEALELRLGREMSLPHPGGSSWVRWHVLILADRRQVEWVEGPGDAPGERTHVRAVKS